MDQVGRAVDACQRGNLEALEELLVDGLNVSAVDSDGCSLLHWAAINNRVNIVKRLLQDGADPNSLGGVLVSSPLHWAARVGSLPSIALLVQAGGSCNIRDAQGYTPIHLAVQGQHTNVVAYLLEKFDNAINITDNSGMTPVMWSAFRTFDLFPIRLLISKKADLDAKEHLQGNTALHLAAQERNFVAVRELVHAGANVAVRNKQQETPLDIARNNRNTRIIQILEKGVTRTAFDKARPYGQLLLASVLFLSGYLLFHYLHYGIAAAILLAIIVFLSYNVKLYSLYSHSERNLIPIGITIGEALCMSVMWVEELHWYVPWFVQVIWLCLMISLLVSLAIIVFSDPGTIPTSNSSDGFVELVESLTPQVRYCFTCWVQRTNDSKHCAVCNRCVKNFDHHCPWVHQCVTRRNLRPFMLFVFCVASTSVIYCVAGLTLIGDMWKDFGFNFVLDVYSFLIITVGLAVFHAIALTGMFIQQCNQISAGTTTYDRILQHRRGGLHTPGPDHSHHHHGVTCAERCTNTANFLNGR